MAQLPDDTTFAVAQISGSSYLALLSGGDYLALASTALPFDTNGQPVGVTSDHEYALFVETRVIVAGTATLHIQRRSTADLSLVDTIVVHEASTASPTPLTAFAFAYHGATNTIYLAAKNYSNHIAFYRVDALTKVVTAIALDSGTTASYYSMDVSADGSTLAIAYNDTRGVKLYDAASLSEISTSLPSSAHRYVQWSPDGELIVVSGDYFLRAYKTADWSLMYSFSTANGDIRKASFTADSQVMSFSNFSERPSVRILQRGISSFTTIGTIDAGAAAINVAFINGTTQLLVGRDYWGVNSNIPFVTDALTAMKAYDYAASQIVYPVGIPAYGGPPPLFWTRLEGCYEVP